MKYKNQKKEIIEINSINDWHDYFFKGAKKKHWDVGRSAQTLAKFMIHNDGEKKIQKIISNLLNEDVYLEYAIPEYMVSFDNYNHGREHDLGIFGNTASGKSIFIGVEAKVDEIFNKKVSEVYLEAKSKELNGKKTNAPQRIEDLLKLNFNTISPKLFDLRYQLLYSTAGTIKEKKESDISVLLILVFITNKYDAVKGKQNFNDYKKFINALDSQGIKLDDVKLAHKAVIDKKEMYSLYVDIIID